MVNPDIEQLCKHIEATPENRRLPLRKQLLRLIFQDVLQPRRTSKRRRTIAPRRPRTALTPPIDPSVWRCADCGTTEGQSLKNADYCRACAQYQPIGAMV